MTDLASRILSTLRGSNVSLSITEIASATRADPDHVCSALHKMDDAGQVIMKNGWYRLSEAQRRKEKAQ